ncbi:similar to Saccharomyces cerevisiae YHR038W RRF1 Mitochondrial ribosome recycling factor [Maudiozyma barnettii]|uniref:Ribosome-recycling factor, mitochondrial n=1 Tax=Maudiozyma barnettii TaxID=61262 RepID=A0A8H2VBV5_9SACH|nr:Rrf1p [Kazachstania barnettii]CAB4252372.1 similar to Saccharomyces cerevisiae YHR038W RRF1 Mitochondrial ribosome recycling factor [Kazachstania barnettii]CAD1779107.1 similar to Saccharomyces cerevisiae YHR038W RRF1 Mitochondrial ribosome recycling factor [Kazachstania barnettii]
MLRLFRITPTQTRYFYRSSVLSKKKPSKGSNKGKKDENANGNADEEEVILVDVKQYVNEANDRYSQTLELLKKKLNEAKQGKTNPQIFDQLKFPNGSIFTEMANTSSRGKNALLVTVFDPKETKNVISLIMGANLNLNPERVPNNEQQLKIALPPPTKESRLELAKGLKQITEDFKNSVSFKYSLGFIRRDILNKMKSFNKKESEVSKVLKTLETTHKDYVNKLQDQLKQAEKSVMS